MNKISTTAYGASGSLIGGKTLEKMTIERNPPKENEVLIEVLYSGVCHSDIHQVNNDWKNTIYPCVPGHEIVGRITQAGAAVTKFNVGDIVGVGCMIDSCQQCSSCNHGEEQYCLGPVGPTMTYNGYFKTDGSGFNTFGGYSANVVVREEFVLRIPAALDVASAAPILCAGVTTYSPLKHWNIQPGQNVAIVGIGGLGHMGVKIAKAMGANVTAITSKEEKRQAALELGAHAVLISDDKEDMAAHENKFDFILITIPYAFDVNDYTELLAPRGTLVTVGLLGPYKEPTDNMAIASKGRSVAGSMIGGIAETQEVLDFCAEHGIAPDVQFINMSGINDAFDKVKDEDVRFRYVIDMSTLEQE